MPLLQNPSIRLRACEPSDIDTLYAWENDTRMWSCGAAMAPYSRAQLEDYVTHYDGNIFSARQLRLMVTLALSGMAVGVVDLYDCDFIHQRCAVGIMIDSDHRRRGYGAQAVGLMAVYCRKHLGLRQLYCIVGNDNPASLGLFAKAGFEVSGHLRSWLRRESEWVDASLLQLLL